MTLEVGRPGGILRGVAADRDRTYVAVTVDQTTTIEARGDSTIPSKIAWTTVLEGGGGPIARTADLLVVTLAGRESLAHAVIRGEPGAALVGMNASDGKVAWRRGFEASDWVVVTALAAIDDRAIGEHVAGSSDPAPIPPARGPGGGGVIVGGSFSGTLRIGDQVVSAAGRSDGFVAAIDRTGTARWLIRVGGIGPDAVQGVAVRSDATLTPGATRIAIAGTVSPGAELGGQLLATYDDRALTGDGFVGVLDGTAATRWLTTFGGKADDTVTGVAIDAAGHVGIAGSLREVVHVAGADLVSHGAADGLLAWWSVEGAPLGAVRIGGDDFDGLSAISAAGAGFVIAGFFSGTLPLDVVAPAPSTLTAAGGDDAFVLAFDPVRGRTTRVWHATGDGREEITALAPIAGGGFVAGVAHTAAARFDGAALPAPADPLAGAAVVVR